MKARTVLSGVPGRYGAEELKHGYQRFLLRALILSSFIHFLFVGTYRLQNRFHPHEPVKPVTRIIHTLDELPQGEFDRVRFIPPVPGGEAVRPQVGIPVPVPEFQVKPEEEFATQQQMNTPAVTGEGTLGGEEAVELVPEGETETVAVPPLFEKAPTLIRKVDPGYPEMARAAGIEGSVSVRMWITKEGKVGEVVIQKSDSELFNEVVLDAARQWAFVPAMMNKGPVAVWWSVVFNFKLNEGR